MFSIKMVSFCKSVDCPASQNLLAFQIGEMTGRDGEAIRRHLTACEFCASEVEFYAHYPPTEETAIAKVEIPMPLLELAQALLGNKHKDFSLLDSLLCENEKVKI